MSSPYKCAWPSCKNERTGSSNYCSEHRPAAQDPYKKDHPIPQKKVGT
jgi:hypothetical protein